jgi:hypothetical protein
MFEIAEVRKRRNGEYEAASRGWHLTPRRLLSGRPLETFRVACANFVGVPPVEPRRTNTLLPYDGAGRE